MDIISQVRKNQPLIHHLTNQVVMNFTANGLLAFGGSPIMAKEQAEAKDMASIASGVLINIGTIVKPELEAMILAGKTANERNIPVVLDPVGVAASEFRIASIESLLKEVSFTAIKGNAGEMANLVGVEWKTKGVESIDDDSTQLEEIARLVSEKYDTLAVVTGKMDVICKHDIVMTNETGHEFLTRITGAGCLLGSILTACLTTDNDSVDAAYEAIRFYGSASEKAAKRKDVFGTGTFLPAFIDELGQ
ncbi:hydroxyethylthiazole kinase [Pseudogracilibacillus sp. SE30717A]|uniref:hydroxyethylthiazole kinase n=1 Tax=Pseudogracilibacillus sp. SE30717A TaxID=3098293 RepID=UPI00300E3B71